MSEFETVAKVGEIPEGEGRAFVVQGKTVGVFLTGDQYYAISDFCPHQGASLSAGHVAEGKVMCPWHGWQFSLKDGSWADAPKSSVRCETYSVRVQGDDIQVLVTAEELKD